jgi:hypothetical protein
VLKTLSAAMMANQPHDPARQALPRVRSEELREVARRGSRDDQEPLDGGSDDQRQNDEP